MALNNLKIHAFQLDFQVHFEAALSLYAMLHLFYQQFQTGLSKFQFPDAGAGGGGESPLVEKRQIGNPLTFKAGNAI